MYTEARWSFFTKGYSTHGPPVTRAVILIKTQRMCCPNTLPSPNVNPYEPTLPSDGETLRRTRWVRPIVILNLILLALPVSAVAFVFITIELEMRREADAYTNGPIVYETEFVGISGPAWPIFAYFAAPNVLMLAYLANRARSQSKPEL